MSQMKSLRRPSSVLAACALALGLLGCTKQATHDVASTEAAESGAERVESGDDFGSQTRRATPATRPDVSDADWAEAIESSLADVFFGFDKHGLNAEARATLAGNAQYLRDNRDVKVWLEGHCDERGTNEYNLALGERRARTVMNYLVQAGVPAYRLKVISYGEERPFTRGHDDAAWAQNRRAHFKARR